MSTYSLRGAQPDVQLHHEHVVTSGLLQEGCRGNISAKRKVRSAFHQELRSWILHQDGIIGLFKASPVPPRPPQWLLLVETVLSL